MLVDVILPLFVLALMVVIVWALFSLVGEMARDRGHNPWPWWLLSIAWSPIASIIILWLFFSVEESN
ncbi:hypothetical protein O4H48_14135 [Rhodobacteraceae bacterium G21628-S1]|nr:hypothetical protein [Rhodobacteraceae bacterium G21628-S1]